MTQLKSQAGSENNLTWFNSYVSREDRAKLHGHKGAVVWFTGLSASGKSTSAHHLEKLRHGGKGVLHTSLTVTM